MCLTNTKHTLIRLKTYVTNISKKKSAENDIEGIMNFDADAEEKNTPTFVNL